MFLSLFIGSQQTEDHYAQDINIMQPKSNSKDSNCQQINGNRPHFRQYSQIQTATQHHPRNTANHRYTFYHANLNSTNNSQDPQKKQERHLPDDISDQRKKSYSQFGSLQKYAGSTTNRQGNNVSESYISKVESPFKKQSGTPKTIIHRTEFIKSQVIRPKEDTDIKDSQMHSKYSAEGHKNMLMVQSTIIGSQTDKKVGQIQAFNPDYNLTPEQDIQRVREQNSKLKQMLAESQQTNKRNEDSLKITRKIMTSLNEKISKIEQDCNEKKNIIEDLEQKLIKQKDKEVINQEQQTKIICMQQEIGILTQQLNVLNGDLMNLDQQNMRLDAQNRNLVLKNTELLSIITNYQLQFQRFNGQNIALTNQCEQHETKIRELYDRLNKQTEYLRFDLTRANEQTQLVVTNYQKLQNSKQKLQQQLQEKERKIEQLRINQSKTQLMVLDLRQKIKKQKEQQQKTQSLLLNQIQSNELHDKQMKSKLIELKSKLIELECSNKKVNQQKVVLGQLHQKGLEAKEQELVRISGINQELQKQLEGKQQELDRLKNKIEEMNECNSQEEQQRDKDNQKLMTDKLNLQCEIKVKVMDNQLLNSELQCLKSQYAQLEKYIQNIREEQEQKQRLYYDKIKDLEEKVRQAKENQQKRGEQLDTLKSKMEKQEEQCKQMIDQYLNKIGQFQEDQHKNPIPSCQDFDQYNDISIKKPSPSKQVPSNMQEWLQQIQEHSHEELIFKVQELYFVNNSLRLKVQDINQMQDNEDEMIMAKLKQFQENIQKYQQQNSHLQETNEYLQHQMKESQQKCVFYQGKCEWMETLIKELQMNLEQTNSEIIRLHVQLLEMKIKGEAEDKPEEGKGEEEDQEKEDKGEESLNEIHQIVEISELQSKVEDSKEFEVYQAADQNQIIRDMMEEPYLHQRRQSFEEKSLQSVKKLGMRKTKSEYYIKDNQNEEVFLQIVCSHVSSDEEEEDEQIEKPEKIQPLEDSNEVVQQSAELPKQQTLNKIEEEEQQDEHIQESQQKEQPIFLSLQKDEQESS